MNDAILPEGELVYLAEFATSLAIGLLIGLERERSPAAKAGLRTFALVAMFVVRSQPCCRTRRTHLGCWLLVYCWSDSW
jgi:hypothetical protein